MSSISGECWQLILLEQKQFYNFQLRNISRPVEMSSVIVFVSRQYWLNTQHSDNICPEGGCAAGWGSVKYPSNNERPLGPLFLASFPTRDWVFVGGGWWRSVIIPNWSWDKWIVSDAAGSIPDSSCSSRICQSLSNIPVQTTDSITRLYSGGKKLQKIPGIMWIMCAIISCKICSRDLPWPWLSPRVLYYTEVSRIRWWCSGIWCLCFSSGSLLPSLAAPLSLPRIVSPATKRVI